MPIREKSKFKMFIKIITAKSYTVKTILMNCTEISKAH